MSHPPSPPESPAEGNNYPDLPPPEAHNRKKRCYRRSWWPKWYWVLPCLALGTFGASHFFSRAPKKYTGTTTLKVEPHVALAGHPISDESIQRGLNTIAHQIERVDLLENCARRQDVRELDGLIPPETDSPSNVIPSPDRLAELLSSWTKVSVRHGTWLVDISVTHPNPKVAPALANFIAREYLADVDTTAQRKDLYDREIARELYSKAKRIDEEIASREARVAPLPPGQPEKLAADQELADLKSQLLVEIDSISAELSESIFWNEFRKDLSNRLSTPDAYLLGVRQKMNARMIMLERKPDNTPTGVELLSLARTPRNPSAPVQQMVVTSGLVGGILLAFALNGLTRR